MKFLCFVAIVVLGNLLIHEVSPEIIQENTEFLARECYENDFLLERDNRLPHTLNTLLAIIRKIENTEGLNMDLRTLSVALLHRFRQDGIGENPNVPKQEGITPYAPLGFQYYRNAETLRFIPGNAIAFPNDSITAIERCTLHFMLSSSTEIFERGDEGTVCRFANNAYRLPRSVGKTKPPVEDAINDDVETLSPEQLEVMTHTKEDSMENAVDPNSLYPELPPNHPDSARILALPPLSRCPVENGVIKTRWGAVSIGAVLAGIAAASQPQTIVLKDYYKDGFEERPYPNTYSLSDSNTLDNKWIATLAGDLAEVALRQGPRVKTFSIGANGNWNSSIMPRWYFLNTNENLDMTTAEIRGGLDGLILANEVEKLYSKLSGLRLSQILDLYYSTTGLFNSTIRACNRRMLFTSVAPNATMSAQTFSAAFILSKYLPKATLDPRVIEKFAVQATRELTTYIPSQMNKDLSCTETDRLYNSNQVSVDLTIILDTNWPFNSVQSIIAHLLENLEISQYNSNFTILNGYDGQLMINSTNSILDFYNFNSSHYKNVTAGFDLPKALNTLQWLKLTQLNNERGKVGGARSDVVLIIPYTSSISESDKDYCKEQLRKMRENIPDTTVLILTYGSKDRWSDLVVEPNSDLFSAPVATSNEITTSLDLVVSRIMRVPKRLINTQCGADYSSSGSSNSYVDYVAPAGTNFYRLHPNYFYGATATVTIQGSGWAALTVCSSRELLHINATEAMSQAECMPINNNEHKIRVSCGDAEFIHKCLPLYLAVTANSSVSLNQCTDYRVCRSALMVKYTISYEDLVCVNSSYMTKSSPVLLILLIGYCIFNIM